MERLLGKNQAGLSSVIPNPRVYSFSCSVNIYWYLFCVATSQELGTAKVNETWSLYPREFVVS